MGGVTLGIPGIMSEFDVGLNNVVNGLISWIVLTLGVGVDLESDAILIWVELLLDSYSPLLRQATHLYPRFPPCFLRDSMVCGGKIME